MHYGSFTGIKLSAIWLPGSIELQAIAIERNGPGEAHTCLQFPLAPAAHAFGNQGARIFGHGSPDWQAQVGLWVLSQRLIQALAAAPSLRQFFSQDHLMDIMAG